MSDLFYQARSRWREYRPVFHWLKGVAHMDDRRIIGGIVYVIKQSAMKRCAPLLWPA